MKKRAILNFHCEVSKMGTHSYRKHRNASVIAFSPSFNEAIRRMRSDLGIPPEGFTTNQEMDDWYKKHCEENTRAQYRPMPPYYWHFPKEFVELLESFSYSDEPSRVNYYPDVPLDRCAMELIRRFDLPEEVVDQVKGNILGARGSLGVGPTLQLILVPVNEGEEGAKYIALVAGIDEATTQKDWLRVWKDVELILGLSGVSKAPYKRPVDRLLLRDLSFWKEIKAGKTAGEALNKWVETHPDDSSIGEDSVRKAVERVDKIMRPEK